MLIFRNGGKGYVKYNVSRNIYYSGLIRSTASYDWTFVFVPIFMHYTRFVDGSPGVLDEMDEAPC